MKKTMTCILLAVVLSNCEIGVRKTNAQYNQRPISCSANNCVNFEKVTVDSMSYGVFQKESYQGGVTVVNLTRDSLECAYYRKMLKTK